MAKKFIINSCTNDEQRRSGKLTVVRVTSDVKPPIPSRELEKHTKWVIKNNRGAWEKLAKE